MALEITPANKFTRIIAKLIDYALVFATIYVILNLFSGETRESYKQVFTIIPVALISINLLYFILLNSFIGNGQTIGKKLTNLEVKKITSDGELKYQSVLNSFIRQFFYDGPTFLMFAAIQIHAIWGLETSFFSFDLFQILGEINVLLVLITFFISPLGIAFHDRVANTIVLSKSEEAPAVIYQKEPLRPIIVSASIISVLIISAHFAKGENETQKFAKLFRTSKYVFENETNCQIIQIALGEIEDNNIAKTEESIVVQFLCSEEDQKEVVQKVKKIVKNKMSEKDINKRKLSISFFDPEQIGKQNLQGQSFEVNFNE